ncbi:sce7726 family protein [Dyadobacter chenhuakuii]|uniref:Sce7726 family protein n=1 Tax=Dyadobacter chenhuakuii TaxID=2909339 RepID=A0A9X1QH82_9BACT|nr:sce7726 family protein [Dyadobacter chenhuakuii]MCF2495401.1 sce7726 family protein [Dyadobacter chenhuakuii]MCF2500457.1 sce7726 family protein [Dyadobacter chenhuakuii]USJ29439.1 sce7726 family protein [Dyadobacter chenhuakuii]
MKNYTALDYTPKLREILRGVYPTAELNNSCRYDLHRKINDLVIGSYEGEQTLKYRLFRAFRYRNLVAAYEIKVRSSRVDFLTINNYTTSFEIKSSLDNLDKLAKQSDDYLAAFEFNYVVVHQRHLTRCIEIIPSSFGVITAEKSGHTIIRKPTLNKSLHPETQLSLLSKKEMQKQFGCTDSETIVKELNCSQINEQFKKALRERYQTRWNFIVENDNEILPIDIQFFFNKNIKPNFIYS